MSKQASIKKNSGTRTTGTVHTCAKACLTSATTSVPATWRISSWWLPKFNHLFTGPLPTSPENSWKSVWKFLHKVNNRQTKNKQWRKHNLLGRGKNI